jgi:hypothetical protein
MKRLLLFVSLLCVAVGASLGFTACKGTLQQGGAYSPITVSADGVTNSAPDMPLFLADSAYQLAYNTVNAAFTTEYNNRDLLFKVSPTIKHTLDNIRPDAVKANADYLKARQVYIANPTPQNLSGVQAVLAKIQQLATAAQAALPKQ